MPTGCFIGIDQGSSATKAVVVSTDGQILFQTRKDLSPPLRDGIRIEQDAEEILPFGIRCAERVRPGSTGLRRANPGPRALMPALLLPRLERINGSASHAGHQLARYPGE